jgi:hypothetical protein
MFWVSRKTLSGSHWVFTATSRSQIAKSTLTERARVWACRRVGEDGDTVEDLRLELGRGPGTVMRAVPRLRLPADR